MVTVEFLLTSLVVVLIPGTGVLFTVSTALMRGRRAGVHAAVGCTAGIVPHLLATILGLAALMHASALAFQTLKYAGVLYLLYLALAMWRDRSSFALDSAPDKVKALNLMGKGILLNLLNPKLTLFFLAFLPQFIDPHAVSPLPQMLFLSGIFMAMTFAVFVIYAFLAHLFRKAVIESPPVQNGLRRSFAAAFAGLGIQLAFSER